MDRLERIEEKLDYVIEVLHGAGLFSEPSGRPDYRTNIAEVAGLNAQFAATTKGWVVDDTVDFPDDLESYGDAG